MDVIAMFSSPEMETIIAKSIPLARFTEPCADLYYDDQGWRGVFHREARAIVAAVIHHLQTVNE